MSIQDKIVELLPEIDDIEDNTLRERVIATWIAAVKHAGLAETDLLNVPVFPTSDKTPDPNLFQHVRAVTRVSLSIAKALEELFGEEIDINFEQIIAGSLLHDVGKLYQLEKTGDGKIRISRSGKLLSHPVAGAILAGELGLSEEILHIIVSHGREDYLVPQTIEATIIHYANLINTKFSEAL